MSSFTIQRLYQVNPRVRSTFNRYGTIVNRSFTDSLESYQYAASKEATILRWNDRIPTHEIVIRFLKEFSAGDIMAIVSK